MTLVEFLRGIPGAGRKNQVLGVLYYYRLHMDQPSMTAGEVKQALISARITGARKVNVADVLAKAGALVDSPSRNPSGPKNWALTGTGEKHVRDVMGLPAASLPEPENDVSALEAVAKKIADDNVRHYIEEAILCLQAGARRAAIVFAWVAAAGELQSRVWAHGASAVTAAAQSHSPRTRTLTKRDDLSELNEALLLQVAKDLGVIDKNEKQMLDQCLTTRNTCGHPNKYRPGVAKVKSHIEDIVSVLF